MKKIILLILITTSLFACKKQTGRVDYFVTSKSGKFKVAFYEHEKIVKRTINNGQQWREYHFSRNGNVVYLSATSFSDNDRISVEILYQGEVITSDDNYGDSPTATASCILLNVNINTNPPSLFIDNNCFASPKILKNLSKI